MSNLLKSVARRAVPRELRNWLKHPGRSARWVWNDVRFRAAGGTPVAVRPGWAPVCHPSAWDFSYHAQQDDPDQVAEFDSFVAACTPGMVLFDVGAHFGLFALAALHYGGPAARAVSVDPSVTAERMMLTQARLNGLGDRWAVLRAAVGAADGEQDMVSVGVMTGGYLMPPSAGHTGRELTRVPTLSLDGLAARFGRPTHVKIDVEGLEADVLAGGGKLLAGPDRPTLFVELHHQMIRDRGGDAGRPVQLMAGFGYRFEGTDGGPLDPATLPARPLVRVVARPA